jgi:hypothetical protein
MSKVCSCIDDICLILFLKIEIFFLFSSLGNHTGKNFADLFYGVLEKYKLLDKLHTVTADNASTNGRMA